MSAVEEVIVRVPGAGDGVDAIHIVHITIAIVVDAIGRLVIPVRVQAGLAGIAPHIGGQVFMRVADARVDHRHHDVLRAGSDVPGRRGIDFLHSPQQTVDTCRVIRHRADLHLVIRFDVLEQPGALIMLNGLFQRDIFRQVNYLQPANLRMFPAHFGAQSVMHRFQFGAGRLHTGPRFCQDTARMNARLLSLAECQAGNTDKKSDAEQQAALEFPLDEL